MSSKWAAFQSLLATDDGLSRKFLDDPDGTLKLAGLQPNSLASASPAVGAALSRARDALANANIEKKLPTDAIASVGASAKKAFGSGFDTKFDPLGFTLLERLADATATEVTATGTIRCTTTSWDGCSGDVDF